ncbi:MAG: hypothetical protein V5A88_05345 [Candidatus Thermoplasmatota archaeon]
MSKEEKLDEDGEIQPSPEGSQGQTQQQQVSQQQPRGAPPAHRQPEPFLKGITTNNGLAIFITIGFVILLIGSMLIHAAPWAEEEALLYSGNMIRDIGVFFVGLVLALGGIHRDDLDIKYRLAMVALAFLLILVAWFGFFSHPMIQDFYGGVKLPS